MGSSIFKWKLSLTDKNQHISCLEEFQSSVVASQSHKKMFLLSMDLSPTVSILEDVLVVGSKI